MARKRKQDHDDDAEYETATGHVDVTRQVAQVANRPALLGEDRLTGTVKWFNDAKGYGFITPDGATNRVDDVFVHFSAIVDDDAERKTLKDGERVEFEIADGKGGKKQAENVVVIR